jgi:hypothetical protein
MPFHSTKVIFEVALAPFSLENKASKKSNVNKVAKTKKVDRWSFKQLFRTLIIGLPPMVCSMTILHTILAALSCIIATMYSKKFASSLKSLSTGNGPWGSSHEEQVSPDPLPRSVFNGKMVVAGVEVVVLLFYACFKLEVFALTVVRSSRAT